MRDLNKKQIVLYFQKYALYFIDIIFSVTFLTKCVALLSFFFQPFRFFKKPLLSLSVFFPFIFPFLLLHHPYPLLDSPYFLLQHVPQQPTMVGQPSVPSSSSSLEVMMNKDFRGFFFFFFFFFSNKLSVALIAIMLGGLLLIYQEDSEDILKYFVRTLVGCLWQLGT